MQTSKYYFNPLPYHRSASFQQEGDLVSSPSSTTSYSPNTSPSKESVVPRINTYEKLPGQTQFTLSSPPSSPTQSRAVVFPEMVTQGQYYQTKPSFGHRFMDRTGLSKLGAKLRIYHPEHHASHRFAYEPSNTNESLGSGTFVPGI